MKKIQYIAPAIEVTRLTVENVIAGSPQSISGAEDLGVGGNTKMPTSPLATPRAAPTTTSGTTTGASDNV